MAIQPSHKVHRLPQTFSERSVWKAELWRSWAIFYSLPMCKDLLPENVLQNYALLVKSLYTHLNEKISYSEVNQCSVDLEVFIRGYEELYDVESMKYNLHMISHMVESTKMSGPIAKTSTFPHKGYNGIFLYCYIDAEQAT